MAGAWEAFPDEQNTEAWYVYDWGEDAYYYPFWDGSVAGEEFAFFYYEGDGVLTFGADEKVGAAAFVGDYRAENIIGVACDVYIGALADLEIIDCTVHATGPGGKTDYYSLAYPRGDFGGSGWWSLYFGFDEPWFYWDGSRWVEVDGSALNAIEALEINFVPREGITTGSMVGLDNVTLEMEVAAPALATSVTGGMPREFRIAFTPGPGLQCRVEKLRLPAADGWDAVPGQTGIKGPDEHVFSAPVTATPGIFRVAAEPDYTLVWSD